MTEGTFRTVCEENNCGWKTREYYPAAADIIKTAAVAHVIKEHSEANNAATNKNTQGLNRYELMLLDFWTEKPEHLRVTENLEKTND